jgi:3',5'-nucleoside bisphosphate phosphatase
VESARFSVRTQRSTLRCVRVRVYRSFQDEQRGRVRLCYDCLNVFFALPLLLIDLHSHSDRSDGALTPSALIERAARRGVRALALTDHDTIEGLSEAGAEAGRLGLHLVPGVEISVTWNGRTLHVVGLGIDPACPRLLEGLSQVRAGRMQRAQAIGSRLASHGVEGAFEAAVSLAANPDMVSRTHFARHMVAVGVVKDMSVAFRRYLGEGKPAYVRHTWASLQEAIDWIGHAGGLPVLAHPGRYGLRRARLLALFSEFRACGGAAVEVISSSHSAEQVALVAELASQCGLLASAGSDFHSPEESWLDVGQLAPLPAECVPVWDDPKLAALN